MVVLEEEAMGVRTGAIRMGTVIIKTISLSATLVLETILQTIPTGTNILGLALKSKFAWRLGVLLSFCIVILQGNIRLSSFSFKYI